MSTKYAWAISSAMACPLVGLIFVAACTEPLSGNQVRGSTPVYQVRVLKVFPHDRNAFSQGLVVEGETLFEGTGQYGKSTLRRVELSSGKVKAYQPLDANYFGEGITVIGERIYQLTWKQRTCVVYDKSTLKPLGVLNYRGEGWGITDDEKQIFMSDGTNTIRVLDPNTFKLTHKFRVKDGRRNIKNLNELEYIDGFLLANVWYEDRIAKIDPKTGAVVAWIDCSGVFPAATRPSREHVLNGIAYDKQSGRIFITGKNWPNLFEIEILDGKEEKEQPPVAGSPSNSESPAPE